MLKGFAPDGPSLKMFLLEALLRNSPLLCHDNVYLWDERMFSTCCQPESVCYDLVKEQTSPEDNALTGYALTKKRYHGRNSVLLLFYVQATSYHRLLLGLETSRKALEVGEVAAVEVQFFNKVASNDFNSMDYEQPQSNRAGSSDQTTSPPPAP